MVSTVEYLRSVTRAVSTLEIVPSDFLVLGVRSNEVDNSEAETSPTKRIRIADITLKEELKCNTVESGSK